MKVINCWEYFRCGREQGGVNAEELGVCPTSTLDVFNGINGGTAAGRYCWTVNGTICHDNLQGKLEDKLLSCINCSFFKLVNYEQGREFTLLTEETLIQEIDC
ncbi:two-CW domain-containing protein [Ancylomarina longa]|uniref:Uncharacterized protein n=1 Tax=Ancylomarina longa TaxID=2487017 RepID=A0A434AFQ7_9BACT|nr:hypothetical protein [Ancylomarina longa]RUT73188.1 hypothetical protein DLK05_14535 [Ancylomarina longa]